MFGFLKDKLKKAISSFTKNAEVEVKEEKIEVAEKPIEKKESPKKTEEKKETEKTVEKPVEKKVDHSKKQHAPETTKKDDATAKEKKEQERKQVEEEKGQKEREERREEKKRQAEKKSLDERKEAEQKQVEEKIKAEQERKEQERITQQKQEAKKEVAKTREIKEKKESVEKKREQVKKEARQIKQEEKPETKKPGFFGRLFGKKEETLPESVKEEIAPILEEVEQIDEEIEQIEHDIVEDKAYEEHITVIAEEETKEEIEQEKKKEEKIEQESKRIETKQAEKEDTRAEENRKAEEQEKKKSEESKQETQEESGGFFGKLKEAFTKKTLSSEKFDELFWELELAMLENNVAVEVIEKIKNDLKEELTTGKVSRFSIEEIIEQRLKQSIEELFDVPTFDFVQQIKNSRKPFKICIIGVNGSGKTTTLAKIINLLQKNKLSVVVAASDTFRAAAIDQLKEHTDRLDVKLISQGYGADPAAVAFDAIKHAEAKNIDVVLIDTAGRLHSNTNLMQELEKVVRVSKPDLKLFVGEAITGNDCIEQAQVFNKLVGIDAIILSKADIDEKGGAAISVSHVTRKPILYLGVGQRYEDLVPFDKKKIVEHIF